MFLSYLITDPKYYSSDVDTFSQKYKYILDNQSANMVCFRDKISRNKEHLAKAFVDISLEHKIKRILINQDINLALKLGATGVHLNSLSFDKIKEAKRKNLFVMISCHNIDEVILALRLGANGVTYSTIFYSPNKPKPKGIDGLNMLLEKIKKYKRKDFFIIALGGIIDDKQISQVKKTGTNGFASIRYFAKQKMQKMQHLVALQLQTTNDFAKNLHHLIELIKKSPKYSIILAPELCLNGYAYDRLEDAVDISKIAIAKLKILSIDKTIALTLTTKEDHRYYNTLMIFSNGEIKHTQSKAKLFVLNDEKKYFSSKPDEQIKIIQIDGIKIACLICFELRFIELWQKIQGADIVLVPAMWGKPRKENFKTLTQALAVLNQCFVLASDSANDDMAKSSGIITPFGIEYRDDNQEYIEKLVNMDEIKKFRRYMSVGINSE